MGYGRRDGKEGEKRVANQHFRVTLHSAVLQHALVLSVFLSSFPKLIHLPTYPDL